MCQIGETSDTVTITVAAAGSGEVGVKGSPADPEPLGNRAYRDGRVLEHRARHRLVGLAELAPAPTLAATGKSGFQALDRALAVQIEKVLSDRGQKVEHQP